MSPKIMKQRTINKNEQKVVEEQEVWLGTNCYVKSPLINLKVSAICTVQQYPNVIKFHQGKLRSV